MFAEPARLRAWHTARVDELRVSGDGAEVARLATNAPRAFLPAARTVAFGGALRQVDGCLELDATAVTASVKGLFLHAWKIASIADRIGPQ